MHRLGVRRQMDPAKKAALQCALPKRDKARSITRTEDFLRRQREKTWLETHVWHAKPAHMAEKGATAWP
jgi:ribonuclease P/MRP protein subunit POP1